MGSEEKNTRRVVEDMELNVHGTEHLETSAFGRESHEERSASTVPPPPSPAGIWKEVVEESSSDTPNPPESEDSLAQQFSL